MSKDNRTWLEKQQDRKRRLEMSVEQAVALRQKLEASQEQIAEIEARIQAQKQEYTYRLFHWILDRQLKKLDKERQQVARMLEKMTLLEQAQQELEKEVERPPVVRQRRVRVVYVSTEKVFFLVLMLLLGWLLCLWLLRR